MLKDTISSCISFIERFSREHKRNRKKITTMNWLENGEWFVYVGILLSYICLFCEAECCFNFIMAVNLCMVYLFVCQ